MIKLIVSDVDGTLVPDGTPLVPEELFDVILKLRERGIQFAIASGRPWASVESTFEPVKKKIFYIANNGAYLGSMPDRTGTTWTPRTTRFTAGWWRDTNSTSTAWRIYWR